jgi:hypothetical protein
VPHTFALGGRLVNRRCVPATRKNRHRRGCLRALALRIEYSLSTSTPVTLTIEEELPGRLTKTGCVAPRRSNRRHRRCQRHRMLPGSIVVSGQPGANMTVFSGRIGGHALGPGNYTVIAGVAGSPSARATFTLLP